MKTKKSRLLYVLSIVTCLAASFIFIGASTKADELQKETDVLRKVSVMGTGIVKAKPDVVFFNCSIVSQEKEAAASQKTNGEVSNNVVAALVGTGILEEDISTVSFNVSPVYIYKSGEEPKLTGYRTTHQLSVRVIEISRIGSVIDLAMEAGVSQIQGIRFGISNREELQKQAIEAATRDARIKAKAALDPEGMLITGLFDINVLSSNPVTPAKREMDLRSPEQGTNSAVMPGTQSISAQVSAVYTFSDKIKE
ncbi:MAG: SIMPL domain-containing protein [Caldisericia bacterium]|nr:SIMPL domain-containing protein [Caldisericia bacterium]